MWYNRKSDNRTLNLGNSDGQGEVSVTSVEGKNKKTVMEKKHYGRFTYTIGKAP